TAYPESTVQTVQEIAIVFLDHVKVLRALVGLRHVNTAGENSPVMKMVTCSRLKRRLPNEDDDGRSEKLLVLGCCTI
ncbi:hypothetical protein DPMN_155770, partial [Dreissena polymorpha]